MQIAYSDLQSSESSMVLHATRMPDFGSVDELLIEAAIASGRLRAAMAVLDRGSSIGPKQAARHRTA